MTNSDLIKKLHNLKDVQPDKEWLSSNRDLLLSQISNTGAEQLSFWKSFVISLGSFSKIVSRPVYALGLFVVLLFGGVFVSQGALTRVKPDNSLYIARIIAEQVKLNTTFNSQDRNRLAVNYAVSHAQDINSVMSNPSFNNPNNKAQVAKLSDSFNQEVDTIKDKIGTLKVNEQPATPAQPVATSHQEATVSGSSSQSDFVIADSSRDGQRISLAVNPSSTEGIIKTSHTSIAPTAATETAATEIKISSSTSSSTDVKASSTEKTKVASSTAATADKIIDEAQKLFNSKDYTQAGLKLDEASTLINSGD